MGAGRHEQQQQRPTVIQIAHELSSIMHYDAVIVMAGGCIVEQGSPQQLAASEGSRFSRLLHGGGG
jgi:ABC-type multidrug transport system fused ATPase/permease subunit